MRQELTAFLKSAQSAFYAGDTEALLGYFRLPLVIYSAAGVVLLRDQEEFIRMVEDYRNALASMSVSAGRQTILSMDPLVNNRTRVTVRTTDHDEAGLAVTGSTVRYFLLQTETGLIIEMMEYLEAPMAISDIEKIVH